MTMVHGGRLVAQALKRHGTTHLFTLCGGHIQAIYDGCLDEGIRVVDVRHEQTAGHAADGYARVTGKPGVCAVTAGPGVTDVVTAVANAQRAGIPMICIGGAGPKLLCDMGSLQDMDHVVADAPDHQVERAGARDAAHRASTSTRPSASRRRACPGPVFLEMPLDLLMNLHDDADAAGDRARSPSRRGPAGDPHVDRARRRAARARPQRPVFLVGTQLRWSPGDGAP